MSRNTRPFLGLRAVIHHVGDMERATSWYTEMIGHDPYFVEPHYIGFHVAGHELGLVPSEGDRSGAGGVEAYWAVGDVPAAYDRLLSLGATALEAPHNVGGPIVVATVRDPWGNIIGLIFDPRFAGEDPGPVH